MRTRNFKSVVRTSVVLANWVIARLQFHGIHGWGLAVATVRGNGIRAYWYRDISNFGDLITPLLLRHYGHFPIFDRPSRAQFVATGSILEHLPNGFSGIILGSGFIDGRSRTSFPAARILAVRGCMTRERLGACHGKVALGDPGLLAPLIMKGREDKKFVVGLVPHYEDKGKVPFAQLTAKHKQDITVIDVQRPPIEVFRAIDQCEHVLSSSLHGLIVSDSLNIPNGWLGSSRLFGGRFKFDDYYSSLGVRAEPVAIHGDETLAQLIQLTNHKPVARIEEIKKSIDELWTSVGQHC